MMKPTSHLPALAVAALLSVAGGHAWAETSQPPRQQPVDWRGFLRQHDMIFDELPRNWRQAPHLGNAMVGSMLFQAGDDIQLQVFRADVQDHRDDTWGWTAYSRPRLMIGHFLLHTAGKLAGCNWRLDLWNAELAGTVTTDKGEIRIRHFVHADDMAIVTELTPSAGEQECRWSWHPAPATTTRTGYPTNEVGIEAFAKAYGDHYRNTLKPYQPNPAGRQEEKDGVSVWVQDLLAGGQYATAWGERTEGQTRTHILSIANTFPAATAAQTAVADVHRFLKLERTKWVDSHRKWWHEYFARSYVTIPEKSLESLYWQTIYRYGCSSRAGRCFVDTSGLWFQGGPWPYVTTDWNIQGAHWGVYAANRLEQGEEIVNRLHAGREALARAVRPADWQEDSAYMAIAVAPDMQGARDGDKRYYDLVGNLPWTLHLAWLQYRYSMDDGMLREKVYPLLRRSMNLYFHLVEKGDDGKLHLPTTYSPENYTGKDCNFDLALFKWGCLTLLKASSRLGIEDPLIPRWKQVAEKLVDFPADERGFRIAREVTAPEDFRHLSHLLMIYPLHVVNIEQEGSREVLRASFDHTRTYTALPAMVQTHLGPIGAVLGQGDTALDSLKRLQADLLPNGLWACAGNPCIESTLGAADIVQNMLIQSWSDPADAEPGPIRIFPALPSAWKDVEFRDLRSEGAFLVSAKRTAGKTEWVRIKSLAGEPCRVRPGMAGAIQPRGDRSFQMQQVSPGVYHIDLKKGEDVWLHSEEWPNRSPHDGNTRAGRTIASKRV